MKDIQLKFKAETGNIHVDFPKLRELSDEYIEWVEDLALKFINQQELTAKSNKIISKFEDIKLAFDNLYSEVTSIDEGEVIDYYKWMELNNTCGFVNDLIYDT